MVEGTVPDQLMTALAAGAEALDRGVRGPGPEIALLRRAGWLTDAATLAGAALCDRLMALGGASLPVARLFEGHVNALRLIAREGSGAQREKIGAALQRGALLGVWGADSERRVTIHGQGKRRVLQGTKAYASGLGEVELAIVTAAGDSGLQMVLVDARDPTRADHAVWDVDGMVGSRSGRFLCDDLPAGPDHCLGPPGALMAEPDFHGGVWRLAACYAGALDRMARLCVDATQGLDQMQQAARLRLAGILLEAQTAALWAHHAAVTADGPDPDPDKAIGAALFAREATEQAAERLLAASERLLGARMHARGHPAGRIARDLRLYLRQADLDGKLALALQCALAQQADNPTSADARVHDAPVSVPGKNFREDETISVQPA